MPYNGKSPAEINIAAMFGGAAKGNLGQDKVAKLEKMANRGGFFSGIAQKFLRKYRAKQASTAAAGAAPQAPSVVQTAGASNMSGRIEGIESRLTALEGSGVSSNPAGDIAPVEDASAAAMPTAAPTDIPTDIPTAMPTDIPTAMPTDISAAPQMPAAQEPIIPQSEQLGSLMASPFTMRQRTNMGPLNLNSPLNGNTFAKAVQDAKATGASTFEVGGKTYNVK